MKKLIFLLVGTILVGVSVFGYVWSQSWIQVDYLSLSKMMSEFPWRYEQNPDSICQSFDYDLVVCRTLLEEYSLLSIYTALSAAGIAIGIILVVYGLIPKRQSG